MFVLLFQVKTLSPDVFYIFHEKKSPHIRTHFEPYWIIRPPHSESQKKDGWGPLFASLFSQDPLCLLFTARPDSSQDSQETHVATNRCAACKHRPSLTRVYPNNSYRLLLHPCPSLTRTHTHTNQPLMHISPLIGRWLQQWEKGRADSWTSGHFWGQNEACTEILSCSQCLFTAL